MEVKLYKNFSENNVIGKQLTLLDEVTATIKGNISKYNPTIILKYSGQENHNLNYVYIPDFHRYYFVTDIQLLPSSVAEISLRCDVLESFKNSIKNLQAVVDRQADKDKSDVYINDGSNIVESRTSKTIYSFNQGFLEEGEWILVAAGGRGGLTP